MKLIALSQGLFTKVDDADFEYLSQWKWSALVQGRKGCLVPKWRAVRVVREGEKQRAILMHRVITGADVGEIVDHDDGDALNNQRGNLIVTTQRLNSVNRAGWNKPTSSCFKGVNWHPGGRKWAASFRGKYLGLFDEERCAAQAYNAAALASGDRIPLNSVGE